MQSTLNQTTSGLKADLKYYAWLVGLTALFGLLIFGWLPGLGIGLPMKLFGYKALLLAMAGVVGGVLYIEYLGYWRRRPEIFLIFCTIFPVLWNFLGEQLIAVGISLRGTLLLFPLVIVPALLVVGRSGIATVRAFPFLKLLFVFLAWTTFLFLFHNINYQPPVSANFTAMGVSRYNDFGSLFLYSVFFEFVCAVTAAWLVNRTPNHRAFFERFNQALALFTLAISIIPVIVFPLGGARVMLEGVWRSTGIFTHPNINAFYLSFLSLYFLGVFLAGVHRTRKSGLLLLSAAIAAGIAILFTFSKTVLFGHLVALAVLLLIHAGTRGSLRKMLLSSAVLLGAGALLLVCVDAFSGNEVSRTLFGRLENNRSLDWRLDLWGRLLTDMHAGAWLFGNGLTSAYQRVYEWLYLDSNPELMVSMQPHNIMIHFVYEMGLLGLAYILALLCLALSPIRSTQEGKLPPTLTLPLQGGGDLDSSKTEKQFGGDIESVSLIDKTGIEKTDMTLSPPPWRGRVRVGGIPASNLLLRSLPVLLFGVYILYYSFNNYDLISGGMLWIVMSVLVVYQQRESEPQRESI